MSRRALWEALSWMDSLSPTGEMRLELLDAQAVKLECELRAAGGAADLLEEAASLRRRISAGGEGSYAELLRAIDRLALAVESLPRRRLRAVSASSPVVRSIFMPKRRMTVLSSRDS